MSASDDAQRREGDVEDPLSSWIRSTGQLAGWGAGSAVFRQGDRTDFLVLVRSGSVKVVSHAESGRQVVLALRGPGDLLGEFAALDGRRRSASVVALTDVDGWTVPSAAFRDHLRGQPERALELLTLVVTRLRDADRSRLELSSLDTVGRVARLLRALDAEHGPGAWVRLTQTELGEAVGASREATVKALARLRRSGLVETSRGRLRVLDRTGLAQLAER